MSNKAKLQQHQPSSHQPHSQHQPPLPAAPVAHQQLLQPNNCPAGAKPPGGLEPLPPRYQPPPQPGILKAQAAAAAAAAHHHYSQQQSKFAQKVELPHAQPVIGRTEKLQQGGNFALQHQHQQQPQPQVKSFLAPGSVISGPGTVTPTAAAPGVNVVGQACTATARQRITDEEFLRLGPVEMLKFVRKTESDMARLATEQHRQIQSLVNELRAMKEANQRLSDDNQELRDLCCFLDDDRQKGRKLAREWQRFGRYTASVMRQEVSAYQNKLRQLDNKQQELIKDNLELKELCLYLDEERGGGGGSQRDDGDGSSSSTNADESAPAPTRQQLPPARHHSHQQQQQTQPNHHHNHHHPPPPSHPHHHHHHHNQQQQQQQATFNDQTMQYVRSLEQRVKQLEEDSARSPADDFHLSGRPEAVVRALQVLEVREQLEREAGHDGEKALVREMCNVVWRKLEEGGPAQNRH